MRDTESPTFSLCALLKLTLDCLPRMANPFQHKTLGREMHRSYGFLHHWLYRWIEHVHVSSSIITTIQNSEEKNNIVYVLPTANTLDYLLLNLMCIKYQWPLASFTTDIPFVIFQPVFKALWTMAVRTISFPKNHGSILNEERQILNDTLQKHGHANIFLKKPGMFGKPEKWHLLLWEQVILSRKKHAQNTLLVPIVFVWSRSPGVMRANSLDTSFQDPTTLSFLKKLFILVRQPSSIEAKVGHPIDLDLFLSHVESNKLDVQAKKLRRLLASYMYRERKVLTGPPIRPRLKVIQKVISDVRLQKTVADHALRKKIPPEDIWKNVHKILKEMVANYKPNYVHASYYMVKWIQERLYQKIHVDTGSLQELKTIARDHSILYLPCHRSHMDYILLSKMFYENGLIPPHIAAGVNLSFFPMGILFRNSGAFFIRRKISGDLIYARTLASYIRWLIRSGYSQEFFIEGTRTRTGKLQPPKVGLLSSELEACLESGNKDLYLVPTAVTYDRVPEESEYRRENKGLKKEKESWKGLFQAKKFLKRKHGSIHVRFAKPISVFEFFKKEREAKLFPSKDRIHALANLVIEKLGENTVLTSSSFMSICILAINKQETFTRDDLLEKIKLLQSAISHLPVAEDVFTLDEKISSHLDFFISSRWIDENKHERTFKVNENHRIVLNFHKNISMHFFVNACLEALTRLMQHHDQSQEATELVKSLFRHEFPYAKNHLLIPNSKVESLLLTMARGYLETYLVVANTLLTLNLKDIDAGKLFKRIEREEASKDIASKDHLSFLMVDSAYQFVNKQLQNDASRIDRLRSTLIDILKLMP